MSLRRSSRAPPPAHSNSSSLSSRDRNTRSHNKATSPRKSSSPGSLSSDDADDAGRTLRSEEPTRRRTRAQDIEEEEAAKMSNGDAQPAGDDDEESEITRCICGHQDYPGPPSDDEDLAIGDLSAEDVGGLFIQCDECKVWQHGGCVGILEESAVPENYFCEKCRKDLHRLLASPKGQKYSHYIPVVGAMPSKSSTRKNSLPKEPESKKDKDKPSRASVEASTKRRSTMNSRAAYDDDEVLRKVLEESKGDGSKADSETGTRKGKRGRDESEDVKPGIKRQRTGSGSSSSSEVLESDEDEQAKTNSTSQKQKPRGAAARSQQERIQREQKEREKERAEAAGKRKGRAERRRAEGTDTPKGRAQAKDVTDEASPEPTPEPAAEPVAEAEQPEAETPAAPSRDTPTAPAPASTKKSSKASQKRGNRVGRNQYTRDRDNASTDRPPASPHRPMGRSNTKDDAESPTGNGVEAVVNGSSSDAAVPAGKGSRNGKRSSASSKLDKLSWKDMNGTAAHMLEYITRVQMEMASEKTNTNTNTNTTTTTSAMAMVKATLNVVNGHGGEKDAPAPVNGTSALKDAAVDGKEENYEGLTSLEMMDVLTRNLVLWQQRFGENGDK